MAPELAALSGKIGCYYKNLVTGETCTWHGDIPVIAASVIKLYVMTEAFAQIEAGKLAMESGDHRTPEGLCAVLRRADVSA